MKSVFPWPPTQRLFLNKTGGGRSESEKTTSYTTVQRREAEAYQAASGLRGKDVGGLKTSTVIDHVHLLLKEDVTPFIQFPRHLLAHFYSQSWF